MQEDWVLCRVFHKSKSEENNNNNNNNQCQHTYEHNTTTTSPPTCYTCQQQTNSSSNYSHPIILPPHQESSIILTNNNPNNIINNLITTSPSSLNPIIPMSYSWSDLVSSSVKNDEDEYGGLLWDIEMDEDQSSKLGDNNGDLHNVPPSCCLPQLGFGDVRFDQDDCGVVFF